MSMQTALAQTRLERPKVSVIVPVYNSSKYLRECLDSILNQTLKEIEVIIIDDGSTDDSISIISEYEDKDDRVRVLFNSNHGTGYTINQGIKLARGEYIAEVDADDFIDPDMYEYLYSIADGADVVKSGYYSYFEDGRDYPYSLVSKNQTFKPIALDLMSRYLVFSFQPTFWSAIYNREFIKTRRLYWNETEGASFQDTSIIFKINALCRKMVWTDKSFYHWRQYDGHSITSQKYPLAVRHEYNCIEEWLDEHLREKNALRDIMSRMRYGTYSWNAGRLEGEEQVKFIAAAALDFQRDDEYQDMRLYGRYDKGKVTFGDWETHEIWRTDPEKYCELLNKAMAQKVVNDWLSDCKDAIKDAIKEAEAEHEKDN
jgi:glycosyltransferase involved in cell wall biosynthesis